MRDANLPEKFQKARERREEQQESNVTELGDEARL